MNGLRYFLNINLHKKILFLSTAMALFCINGIIIFTLFALDQASAGYFKHMISFALLENSQIACTIVYLYLLLNAKIRFGQLNKLLK